VDADKKIKILLAEDSKSMRLLLADVLQANFPCKEVAAMEDGHVAWERIHGAEFDLIISDWNMPTMGGDELLARVRKDEKLKDTPFLMMTSRSDRDSVVSAIKAGVTEYIIKPFDDEVIIEKVEKLLGIKASAQPAAE
jgi:two-component system chemotaxis response regulator CheY